MLRVFGGEGEGRVVCLRVFITSIGTTVRWVMQQARAPERERRR